MRARSVLVVAALSIGMLTGCAQSSDKQDGEGGKCISPLHLDGRTYIWTPSGEDYVTPGAEAGTATYEPCSDSDVSKTESSGQAVYVFPDVPPEEAVIVTDAHGEHGRVYRVDPKPAGGWDPDFAEWLERVGAQER